MAIKYAFWNNKGGTGKTSLAFQSICRYAELNPNKKILAIDVCPQANLSELFLGGLTNDGSGKLLQIQGSPLRASIGGYFQIRLPSPYVMVAVTAENFIITPHSYNGLIPNNVNLICGDPILELQSNAINTLANNNIPGTNTWFAIISWLNDLIKTVEEQYDVIFIDCNPSFSIYTQIALASVDRIVLPVMADDSSRRAVQNALSLVYGLCLPSPIYTQYAFNTKLQAEGHKLPKVHLIAKNRITQYMGSASAYHAVLMAIEKDINDLASKYPDFFTFSEIEKGMVEIRDFQTTGVIAFAKGSPFSHVKSGKQSIGNHRVQVKEDYRLNCIEALDELVNKL